VSERKISAAFAEEQNAPGRITGSVSTNHLLKGGNWPEYAFPGVGSPPAVQRDDGMSAPGWRDGAAGPFESRRFDEAAAAKVDGCQATSVSL
jgi:hypothetical protein